MFCILLLSIQQATFEPLGMVVNGVAGLGSYADAISTDGSVTAGTLVTSSGDLAVRWRRNGTSELLLLPPSGGFIGSHAFGLSDRGDIVAGELLLPGGQSEAAVWGTTFGLLRPLPGVMSSFTAVSADGYFAVGHAQLAPGMQAPIRVDLRSGAIDWIVPSGGQPTAGIARALSSAGRVVGGNFLDSMGNPVPFVWTAQDGVHPVPLPGGHVFGTVTAVSMYEDTLAGYFVENGGAGGAPTATGGWWGRFVNGIAAWNIHSVAIASPGPGLENLEIKSCRVGYTSCVGKASGTRGEQAFFNFAFGTTSVQQYLNYAGASIAHGWTLTDARAVSADRDWIVGVGTNALGQSEAWRAYLSITSGYGDHSCANGAPNSIGFIARMGGASYVTPLNTFAANTNFVPLGSIGYYIASPAINGPVVPPGSIGDLCLSGSIVRLNGYGQVCVGGGFVGLDTSLVPPPLALAQPGDQWSFQFWYRDRYQGIPTSTFSDALTVTMQ